MLRPQVFALQKGEVEIGLICSEKQAIDATLQSLAREDPRFGTVADRYWNARGGSYTDGGAFIFNVQETGPDKLDPDLRRQIRAGDRHSGGPATVGFPPRIFTSPSWMAVSSKQVKEGLASAGGFVCGPEPFSDQDGLSRSGRSAPVPWSLFTHREPAEGPDVIELLTLILDRRYPTGQKRRRSILQMVTRALERIFGAAFAEPKPGHRFYLRIDFEHRDQLRAPKPGRRGPGDRCPAASPRRG